MKLTKITSDREIKIMEYQITINPTFDMCRWQIEEMNPVSDSIEKITCGEINPENSANPISFIADEIVKICSVETKQKRDLTNLKFDLNADHKKEKIIGIVDFFQLYGLLSVKLNPLKIQMSA